MQRMKGPFRVYVGLVSSGYLERNPIEQIIQDGIVFCGIAKQLERLKANARTLIKSDVFEAHPKNARHGYTHPVVVHAALKKLTTLTQSARFTLFADTPGRMPGFRSLKRAHGQAEAYRLRGYYEFEHLFPGSVSLLPADEARLARYSLSKGGLLPASERKRLASRQIADWEPSYSQRLVNEITAPAVYAESDFVVYMPKLKTSVLSDGLCGAVRLGYSSHAKGIFNDHFIADMLEVCNPQLVIGDGIIAAAGGHETTQRGHELGVILISNNALAHDWIAAQILNLDPLKIRHLRIAQERGWCPGTNAQIELGGSGRDAIGQLAQKSRQWDMGLIQVQEFKQKFEAENSGLHFPIEILSGPLYEGSGSHNMVLSWLYRLYDLPSLHPAMARWAKASVLLGTVSTFPQNRIFYAIGERAVETIPRIISKERKLIGYKGVTVSSVQLKNGRRHFAVKSPQDDLRSLTLAFAFGSLGRMAWPCFSLATFIDRTVFSMKTKWRFVRNNANRPPSLIPTSRLKHNSWWALKLPIDLFSPSAKSYPPRRLHVSPNLNQPR